MRNTISCLGNFKYLQQLRASKYKIFLKERTFLKNSRLSRIRLWSKSMKNSSNGSRKISSFYLGAWHPCQRAWQTAGWWDVKPPVKWGKKLETLFASKTRAKVRQLKIQLRSIKKSGDSVNHYFLKIKIVDSLASVGFPITMTDNIEAILDGLFEEFEGFIISIITTVDPYTIEEVELMLMTRRKICSKQERNKNHFC